MAVNWKKIRKVTFIVLGAIGLILGCLYFYFWYTFEKKYIPSKNQYEHRIAYIDPEKALLSEGFEICSNKIIDYYNLAYGDSTGQVASYSKGKNGLRKFIQNNYKNKDYLDSGYLNIRFVINCHGETGRYIIHENDLDLKPTQFTPALKEELFKLTTQLNYWNPNIIRGKARDSYMYISYRIENGEIIEILP